MKGYGDYMKLLIDARTLGNHPSGIGMYTFDFLKELINDGRFEIILLSDVATSNEMGFLAKQNVTIVTYGTEITQNIRVLKYFKFVQDSIDYYQPDIFWEPNNLIPVKLRRFSGKIMVTIHDIFPLTQPETHDFIYSKYFRYSLSKTLKQADMITYNSIETKLELERVCPQAKDISHLVSYIIVNKPDITVQPVSPDVLFQDVKIDGQDYFLYIGNLEKRKGTDLLLRAYKKYRDMGGKKMLYLGGKIRENDIHDLYDDIRSSTQGLVSLGYVDAEQKDALFRNCSGFVFPSRAEGFGIPIIEAMHYNKPILASNLSIFQEITGNAISYFDINTAYDQQVQNLADAMFHLKSADLDAYKTITNRYLPNQLGADFCNYVYGAKSN